MAQTEGRTLWRAPQTLLKSAMLFVVLVVAATALGLGVHQLKAFAEIKIRGDAVAREMLPNDDATSQSTAEGSAQELAVSPLTSTARIAPDAASCTPGSYDLPSTINLQNLPDGITTIEDSPQTYTIFGDTIQEQREQLVKCSPLEEFAGAASYQVSWQYGYAIRGDGQCEIVSPKIGLHLNMVLPRWTASSNAPTAVQTHWDTFSKGLLTHERGHYAISRDYAKTMFLSLRRVPVQDCDTIRNSTNATMAAILNKLKIAQENYDATTRHGDTQGATL